MKQRATYREALGFGFASFAVIVVLGIVSSIAIARMYGVRVVGEYALVLAPTTAVGFLSSVREQAALVRELAVLPHRAPRITGLFGAVMVFSAGLTLAVSTVTMVITYFVFKGPVGHPELFVPALVTMAGFVVLYNTSWNLDMVFSAFRAGRQLFWIRLHEAVAFLSAAIVGGVVLDDIWGLVIATLLSYTTVVLHRLIVVRSFMRLRVDRDELREGFRTLPVLIKFGLKLTPGAVADGLSNQAGTWMLGISSSVVAVGAYSRAWLLARRMADLNTKVAEMLFPTLIERRKVGDHAGFDRALIDSVRYTGVGLLLPAAAGGGAAHGIMRVFGPGFDPAADALALLLVMPALTVMTSAQGLALLAHDRPLTQTFVQIGRMVFTIGATVPLTLAMGITGTALAVTAGYAIELVVRWQMTRRYLSQPPSALWPHREMVATLAAFAAGFASARLTDSALPTLPGVLAALAVGTIVYAVTLFLTGGLNSRDRERMVSVWDGIRDRVGRPGDPGGPSAGVDPAPDPAPAPEPPPGTRPTAQAGSRTSTPRRSS